MTLPNNMNKEKIAEIYKSVEDNFNSDSKNEVFKGLLLMSKYCDDITLTAEHDSICAYLKDEDYDKITEEDLRSIFNENWMWNEEFEGFQKFV
jgi:hypothetical protein